MKIVHKDPCRKLLEKLPKSAIIDLAIEAMRQIEARRSAGGYQYVDIATAQKHLEPILHLLGIPMPRIKVDPCTSGCCPIRRPTKKGN